MTVNKQGYIIPSTFQMINSIQQNEPKMLLVHQTEFERICKLTNKNKNLSKPYLDFLKMLYIKYILNNKVNNIVEKQSKPSHIGLQMLQSVGHEQKFLKKCG